MSVKHFISKVLSDARRFACLCRDSAATASLLELALWKAVSLATMDDNLQKATHTTGGRHFAVKWTLLCRT